MTKDEKQRRRSAVNSEARQEELSPTAAPELHNVDASDPANIELVFGFVGPSGIDLDKVCDVLKAQLKALQYECVEIRISALITNYLGESHAFQNFYHRTKTLMERGTRLREETKQADIAARLAVFEIRQARRTRSGNANRPARRTAYLIRSFKRREEVELFRNVYGKAFTLISVYASKLWRTQFLKKAIASSLTSDKAMADRYAAELIAIDHDEEGKVLGQCVGKTFPLADFFVTSESRPELEKNLRRLAQLTFGNSYISPSRDEQAMFFAKAAALRSLDLSRQVGAAIVSADGDLLTTGCNEVPKFGGGLYWAEDTLVERDFERGMDSNVSIKKEIVEEVFDRLKAKRLLTKSTTQKSSAQLATEALFDHGAYLKDSQIFDVIEFDVQSTRRWPPLRKLVDWASGCKTVDSFAPRSLATFARATSLRLGSRRSYSSSLTKRAGRWSYSATPSAWSPQNRLRLEQTSEPSLALLLGATLTSSKPKGQGRPPPVRSAHWTSKPRSHASSASFSLTPSRRRLPLTVLPPFPQANQEQK